MPSDTPIILAFDTSAALSAAVLLRGDMVLAQRQETLGRNQVQRLFPMLEEILAESAIQWPDLTAIAVCVGPGNFTGTRIGVSAARGLAMSLKIPAIGVSVFEAAALAGLADDMPDITVGMQLPRDRFGVQRFAAGQPPLPLTAPSLSDRGFSSPFEIAHIAEFARQSLANGHPTQPPAPLYLRPADAAPAKDQPPVILDDS
ncbi:MAG: tRNA (adenosine(37)-N6)-threonylcarbamoyltransferase complex dimerization subunit type 1 TsaB [Rhodobacteraceae bacterium]|nr:tRNA (adenosine(37)-N6)-threonylcarbamoyltransferase complex dimerization subunit type 1 TsaB [Paracoccaceae bacterium]